MHIKLFWTGLDVQTLGLPVVPLELKEVMKLLFIEESNIFLTYLEMTIN